MQILQGSAFRRLQKVFVRRTYSSVFSPGLVRPGSSLSRWS